MSTASDVLWPVSKQRSVSDCCSVSKNVILSCHKHVFKIPHLETFRSNFTESAESFYSIRIGVSHMQLYHENLVFTCWRLVLMGH